MHSHIVYNVGIMKNTKQYTIRGVTKSLDGQLRKLAQKKGVSLNTWVLEVLMRYVGMSEQQPLHHDFDDLCGKWVEDKDFNEVLADQRKIDEELWK
jgi:hypothetical protein